MWSGLVWRCVSGVCDDVVCVECSCVLCCVRGCMPVVIASSCVDGQCLQFHLSDLVFVTQMPVSSDPVPKPNSHPRGSSISLRPRCNECKADVLDMPATALCHDLFQVYPRELSESYIRRRSGITWRSLDFICDI